MTKRKSACQLVFLVVIRFFVDNFEQSTISKMKGSVLVILFAGLFLFSCKSETAPVSDESKATFENMEWITGQWQFTNESKGQITLEDWEKTGDYELTGKGVTKEGEKVVFDEKLSITVKDSSVYYVVKLHDSKKKVWFRVTESDPTYFMAENPENDFPKQIRYTHVDEGHRARIELMGGKRVIMNYFKTK